MAAKSFPPVRSMTTKCLSLVSRTFLSNTCTRMLPPIITGIITRPMMNALVRTAARYSRTAITNVLRMGGHLRRRLRGPGNAHKDVVESRPRHLKVTHAAALHQLGEQLLRVGVALQAQLL